LANDDKELSIDVLASLSVEGKRRNIVVLLEGEKIDDITKPFQ
jgi:hypothetical protein